MRMTMGNGTANNAKAMKAATANTTRLGAVSVRLLTRDDGLDDDGDDRRSQPQEKRVDSGGVAVRDVEGRQHQQGDCAGEDEQRAGDEAAVDTVE